MILTKKYSNLENISIYMFIVFLFLSIIFCNCSKVTNLFHLSSAMLLLSLILKGRIYQDLINNKVICVSLILIIQLFLYFSFSNLWDGTITETLSTIKHSCYLIMFIILTSLTLQSNKRHIAMISIIFGVTCLSLFTIITDASTVIFLRKVSFFNPGPNNVIDLAGYCSIAILFSIILSRESQCGSYLFLSIIPCIMLLMTQSRGSILSLILVLLITMHWRMPTIYTLGISILLIITICIVSLMTPLGKLIIIRFENLYSELWLRFSIWHYAFTELSNNPWIGYGFNHDLNFFNYKNSYITTTHSVYVGTLYKGGVIGFSLFLLLIGFCLYYAIRTYKSGHRIEISIFLFMLFFISFQGMFIIGNPRETWILFWIPLATVIGNYKILNK